MHATYAIHCTTHDFLYSAIQYACHICYTLHNTCFPIGGAVPVALSTTYVNKTIGLKINLNEYHIKVNFNIPVAIDFYAKNSVHQLLGCKSRSTQLKI